MIYHKKQAVVAIILVVVAVFFLGGCAPHQDAKAATGTVTFVNTSFTALTVPKGITFKVGSVQIVTDAAAVVPPASVTPPQVGQVTVPAHAVPAGAAGNIPALAINESPCCGSPSLAAQNQSAFTGGQDAQN